MKRINKNIFWVLSLSVVLFTTACTDMLNEVTQLQTDRLFRPISFAYALNKTNVTLTWVAVNGADSYTLQISDDVDFKHLVVDQTVSGTTFSQELAGATDYYARVRANAAETAKNSEFNSTLTFKTPSENIFTGYATLMTALNTLTVKWAPGLNVTNLILTSSDSKTTSFDISSEEKIAGVKVITSVPNSSYKVEIYNGTIKRGGLDIVVEGDIYLPAGGDLPAAIASATEGQVIVLEPGALFLTGSAVLRFDKSIKIRGLLPTNLPVLAMTSGTPSATSNMFGFADGSNVSNLSFQNVDITGYCNNDPTAIKIGYIFNNNLMTTVGTLSFDNCKIHNIGNTPVRLQAAKSQVIDLVSFKNCSIWEIGFSSTYAIVNVNSADYINNISFNGCTVYNFKGSLVLRTVTAPVVATMGYINITNCTINQGMQDPSSSRYLIDANNTSITTGINITNTIFGSSGGTLGANGIRTTGSISVAGSYYTSDYVDDPTVVVTSYSIKKLMTAFSGASTALWNDPVNGDFKLKATSFAGKGTAGDLRWY